MGSDKIHVDEDVAEQLDLNVRRQQVTGNDIYINKISN